MIKAKHVFTVGFIISLIAFNLHPYLWEYAYDELMSITYACFAFTIVMMSTGQFFWFAKFVFLCTLVQVFHEFIGCPFGLSWVEYFLYVCIFTYYLFNYKLWKN